MANNYWYFSMYCCLFIEINLQKSHELYNDLIILCELNVFINAFLNTFLNSTYFDLVKKKLFSNEQRVYTLNLYLISFAHFKKRLKNINLIKQFLFQKPIFM